MFILHVCRLQIHYYNVHFSSKASLFAHLWSNKFQTHSLFYIIDFLYFFIGLYKVMRLGSNIGSGCCKNTVKPALSFCITSHNMRVLGLPTIQEPHLVIMSQFPKAPCQLRPLTSDLLPPKLKTPESLFCSFASLGYLVKLCKHKHTENDQPVYK